MKLLAVILSFILGIGSVSAQNALLDKSFGSNGILRKGVLHNGMQANGSLSAMTRQNDGKILILGGLMDTGNIRLFIARMHHDGNMDSGFGNLGFSTAGTVGYQPNELLIQSDGKIVISGQKDAYTNSVVTARFHENGTRDSSYGINSTTQISPGLFGNPTRLYYRKMLLLADNSLLLAYEGTLTTGSAYFLLKLSALGKIDSTYGVNGIASYSEPGSSSSLIAAGVQSDGKPIVIFGRRLDSCMLQRHNSNGGVDSSFGINGKRYLVVPSSNTPSWAFLKFQPDGKMVLAGMIRVPHPFGTRQLLMLRLHPDGSLDNNFGNGGKTTTVVDTQFGIYVIDLHINPDGKLLVSASAEQPVHTYIIQFLADGNPDYAFGKRGIVAALLYTHIEASLLQPNGKILLGGISNYSDSLLFTRFSSDPYYYNEIVASVFLDKNADGVMNGSDFLVNAPVSVTKPGIDTVTYFADGKKSFDVDTGTFIIKATPTNSYFSILPGSFSRTFASYFHKDSVSFAMSPTPGMRDLSVKLFTLNSARPGQRLNLKIKYANQGTEFLTGVTVKLVKDYRLSYDSASVTPASLTGDTLMFYVGDLYPLSDGLLHVNLKLAVPPAVNVGDTLANFAQIFPIASDLNAADNTSDISLPVMSSFDPNDKTEFHAGRLYMDEYQSGESLEYLVRFQNTGNDTAFNVYIHDTLDNNLDWSSFEMIAASHNYQLQLTGGKAKFSFSNILLPDSSVNEAGSHGFVIYRIKPKTGLPAGTVFTNKADIYFDYNEPVTTNTESTKLMAQVLPLTLLSFDAYRNGEGNLLEWTTTGETNVKGFGVERSANSTEYKEIGRVEAGLYKYSFNDIAPLAGRNFYRLKIIGKDGRFSYSAVKVVDDNRQMQVRLYPNPATGKVTLQVESLKATTATVKLINVSGVVVKNWEMRLERGVNQSDLSLEGMASGVYFMKINVDGAMELKRLVVK